MEVYIMKKLFVLIILSNLVLSAMIQAQNVLAVLPSDNALYRKVLDGFKSGSGAVVTEYIMEEGTVPADKIAGADVIFAMGEKVLQAVKSSGKPVVFSMVFVGRADFDGRSSGVTLEIPADVKLKKIMEFLPSVKNIGVIYSAKSKVEFDSLSLKGTALKLNIKGLQTESNSSFETAYTSIKSGLDVFIMTADSGIFSPAVVKSLIEKGLSDKISVVGISSIYARAGSLMAFDYDYMDMGIQAGKLAAGGKNGVLEYPKKILVVINADTASAINAPLSADALSKADQVIRK
jgi:putative ABC transport system substrate-binding protein